MSDEPQPAQSSESHSPSAAWPIVLLVVVAAAVLIGIQLRRPKSPNPFAGQPLPVLGAEGWLNTDAAPTPDELRGRVVLVDFWATDCPTCVREMPELAEINERFRDEGLVVVGLTPETGDEAQRVEKFVERQEIDWPIGYGTGFLFETFGIQFTPTYVLFDRGGRSVWAGHSLDGAEDAIVAALAKKEGESGRRGEGEIQ
jgi:thiol-disulfide isomerase/thioredoxin